MNEILIGNWNALIGPRDEVFHLGDVALGPWSEWDKVLTRLNGFKILVVGNHDRVFKGMSSSQQERFEPLYADWFDVVTDEVKNLLLSDGTKVNLSHFPYTGDSHDGDRYEEFRLADEGKTLIHGHTHAEFEAQGMDARVSRTAKGTLQIHVGVDAWNYAPVPETEVLRLISENI